MADTTRDVRLMVVERLLSQLQTMVVRQRAYGSVKQTAKAQRGLEELVGKAASLRYSYMEDADLAAYDETAAVAAGIGQVVGSLRDNPGISAERLAFLDFVEATVGQLPAALRRSASIDCIAVVEVGRVSSVEKAKGAKNLLLCRVDVFDRTVKIVTNLTKTRAGDLMKVAWVPPAEIMGVLSEAQFVGRAAAGSTVGERPSLSDDEAQEIRRAMGAILDD